MRQVERESNVFLMIQTILFATDLCVFTPVLLKHAINLSQRWGARVVLVHAIEPEHVAEVDDVAKTKTTETDSKKSNLESRAFVESVKDRLVELLADEMAYDDTPLDVFSDVVVEIGTPNEIILNQIEQFHADVVVLGSHSPSDQKSLHMGSVALGVMQQSKIPVYFVPLLPSSPAARGYENQVGSVS